MLQRSDIMHRRFLLRIKGMKSSQTDVCVTHSSEMIVRLILKQCKSVKDSQCARGVLRDRENVILAAFFVLCVVFLFSFF